MTNAIGKIAATGLVPVIGGADSFTSILIVSRWENALAAGLAVAGIVLLAAGAVIYFKKRR